MKVLFFSWLADELEKNEIEIETNSALSINEIKKEVINVLGSKANILNNSSVLCAINLNLINSNSFKANPNDEIAFFPPVTGG